MDYKEFSVKLRKADQKKQAKVRNSWGVYDCYKLIRKNGWYNIGRPLKEHEFYAIIRGVNKMLADEIAKGNTFVFPAKMGKLELRKFIPSVRFVNGKLVNTYGIDWRNTIRLWYEDEECRKSKTLVRFESTENYSIRYNKYNATFDNRCFYEFQLNRFIKIAFRENINKGIIKDSLW